MILKRGLAALIFSAFFLTLGANDYLIRDDVVHNPKFSKSINTLGRELYDKTGVSLYLVMLRDLEANQSIADFEAAQMEGLKQPAVMLTFAELPKQVEIFARPASMYEAFDKKQILSPHSTFVESLLSSMLFARSWDEFMELTSHYGGTILPILGRKAKGPDIIKKYSVAMYNGYRDIAEQIAASQNVELSTMEGNSGEIVFWILRVIFYGIIIIALLRYAQIKLRQRRTV